jgi:NitT/TauT family transport system ATP-binding protein
MERPLGSRPDDAVLELRGVGKTYASSRTGDAVEALAGIDCAVRRGEFFAVVGPSGCGKSTLLSLVAGFIAPTAGEVLFEGQRVTGPGPERGVMFQDYALFPWRTVTGNVEFGPYARGMSAAARHARAVELIQLVGLQGFERRYPHALSGGMRQRCALARMLANSPRMWLMDEPLAAVDLQTRIILQDELLRLWGDGGSAGERPTVLFVTHGIDEAVLLADRILVLARRPGRVKTVVDIDLPRPRAAQRGTPEVARLTEALWTLIRDDAARAIAEESESAA